MVDRFAASPEVKMAVQAPLNAGTGRGLTIPRSSQSVVGPAISGVHRYPYMGISSVSRRRYEPAMRQEAAWIPEGYGICE